MSPLNPWTGGQGCGWDTKGFVKVVAVAFDGCVGLNDESMESTELEEQSGSTIC